ncbi:hypothetical protein EBU95_03910 [bacterium]|nr:hypothetical protein [bacterium]
MDMKLYDSVLLTLLTMVSLFELFVTLHVNKRQVNSMVKKLKSRFKKSKRKSKPKLKLVYESKAVNE